MKYREPLFFSGIYTVSISFLSSKDNNHFIVPSLEINFLISVLSNVKFSPNSPLKFFEMLVISSIF